MDEDLLFCLGFIWFSAFCVWVWFMFFGGGGGPKGGLGAPNWKHAHWSKR